MPRISEDTIQAVAAANDVVDVIGGYLQLKRAGSNFKGLCPFHNEKTPSFLVNPARQTYKCFGCGAGGGVFRFVMDYEKVDYPTAVRKLAARVNIQIAEESAGDEVRRGERDRLLTLHREAAAWFHENLMRQKFAAHARDYLKGRGINSEIAVRWKLGYAPEEWQALADWGRGAGYTEAELVKSGLVLARDRGDGVFDRFRNRVMFAICNDYGEVIGFSGRTLGDDPAKYVNSPETPIFVKGRVLFGLEKTKRAIIDANEAIVCEGQLDLIAAYEAGVQNVTAPQGTAFTAQQARLVRRFAESVVLCFDSDAAGRKAVERSLPALLAVDLSVRVARVPQGEDPDSLVRKQGADAFRAILSKAQDYFETALTEELPSDATPRQRAALSSKLAGFVNLIDNPALREATAARVRSRLQITDATFASLMKSAPKPDPDREVVAEEAPLAVIELSEPAQLLGRLAIASPEVRQWIKSQPQQVIDFGPEYYLIDKIVQFEGSPETLAGFAAFCATLSAAEERLVSDLRLEAPPDGEAKRDPTARRVSRTWDRTPKNALERATDAWKGLLRHKLTREIAKLQVRMRDPDTSAEELNSLHKQILDLQRRLIHV